MNPIQMTLNIINTVAIEILECKILIKIHHLICLFQRPFHHTLWNNNLIDHFPVFRPSKYLDLHHQTKSPAEVSIVDLRPLNTIKIILLKQSMTLWRHTSLHFLSIQLQKGLKYGLESYRL